MNQTIVGAVAIRVSIVTVVQWLLGFHLLGAFLFVSGGVAVGVLHTMATFRERPSDVAFLLGLTRAAVALVAVGSLLTLGLGAWLVRRSGFHWGAGWIAGALALWIVSVVLGAIGGRSARHARYLAERLAADGDRPSDELRQAVADPVARALNFGSSLAVLAILALMIWKPGT
jgi:uncharacterized membrane protein